MTYRYLFVIYSRGFTQIHSSSRQFVLQHSNGFAVLSALKSDAKRLINDKGGDNFEKSYLAKAFGDVLISCCIALNGKKTKLNAMSYQGDFTEITKLGRHCRL